MVCIGEYPRPATKCFPFIFQGVLLVPGFLTSGDEVEVDYDRGKNAFLCVSGACSLARVRVSCFDCLTLAVT